MSTQPLARKRKLPQKSSFRKTVIYHDKNISFQIDQLGFLRHEKHNYTASRFEMSAQILNGRSKLPLMLGGLTAFTEACHRFILEMKSKYPTRDW